MSTSPVANKQLFKHIFLTISGLDTNGLAVGYTLNCEYFNEFLGPGTGEDDSLENLKHKSRDTVPLETAKDCQIDTQVCMMCFYDAQIQAHFPY